MDEMKIKLSTKFMKNMVAKIISKAIFKSFGVKPVINISDLEAELKNGKIYFSINATGEINQKVFVKIDRLLDE